MREKTDDKGNNGALEVKYITSKITIKNSRKYACKDVTII